MLLSVSLLSGYLLSGCSPSAKQEETSTQSEVAPINPGRQQVPHLTQEQAERRSSRVSNVAYQLHFELTGQKTFSAKTTLNFSLKDASSPLTVDLNKATIKSLVVNGKNVEVNYNQWFITLPTSSLKAGGNKVEVRYSRLHSTNGEGLHRFVDSVDDKVYLFSHFEPAAANQMFASFDQPDLKATYELTVKAPADWTVISATRETSTTENDGVKRWKFPVSKRLSTYNFSLHAGPYKMWSDSRSKYPMRVFIRQSIAEKIEPEYWFKYTAAGLDFFDQYFGIPYPFEKYDQIIVPDFIYGAMENAAAITFAEAGFTSSAKMTAAQKQRLAGVIMHEMAHQWFGDLVTMKWWNGLWLNESFASFMGTLATAESTEFDYAWRSFYASNKQGAYRQDQTVTTHPIEVPVPTTANAFDNIDAITYSKGASTLMQLRHLLGPDVFQKGVQNYLTKHSYKNAELDDFIGSLAQAAGRSLDGWKEQWLYHAGVNSISAKYQCKDGKITQLLLAQSAKEKYPTLREQKVQIGLFKLDDNQFLLSNAIPVIYSGKETNIEQAIGMSCPDLLYPNYQDWGFVKVNLDQRSFNTAKKYLANVSDPLLRSMLWQSLWDSANDGDIQLSDYLAVAIANIGKEEDYTTLGQSLRGVGRAMRYVKLLGDKASGYYQQVQPKLESVYWENALNDQQGSDFQRRWFQTFVSRAESKSALIKLKKLLDGEIKIEGITVNQDYRWNIIDQLSRFNFNGSSALIEKELKADTGDSGQKRAIAAKAVRPDSKTKRYWLDEILNPGSKLPFPKQRLAMGSLYTSEQSALVEESAAEIFEQLKALDKAKDRVFMRSFARSLIPATCTKASVKRLSDFIEQNVQLSSGVMRSLLLARENDERCVMIGEKFSSKPEGAGS